MVWMLMTRAWMPSAASCSAAMRASLTIKPLDEEIVIKAAKECGKVITAEEQMCIRDSW